MKKTLLFFIVFLPFTMGFAQIEYTNSPPMDANEMAQKLVGVGVEVFNAQLTCPDVASGYFWNGNSTNLRIDKGIALTTGSVEVAFSPNDVGDSSIDNGGPGSSLLEEFPHCYWGTVNACILEFDFIPSGTEISLNYVFASEEYPEWVGSQFNDMFAILLEGEPEYPSQMPIIQRNIATIPGSPDPGIHVAINFLNAHSYSELYQDNTDDSYFQYDGQTLQLLASAVVTPLNTYRLTLVIADSLDPTYDSGLFFEEGSLSANILRLESKVSSSIGGNSKTITEACSEGILTFSIDHAHIPLEGAKVPVVMNPNPNMNKYVIALGGTAKLFEDYEISHPELIIPPPDSQELLSTEKFTEQWHITPIADGLEEELEYITIGIYSGYADDYLSIDTLWLEDEQTATITYDEEAFCAGESIQLEVTGVDEDMSFEWSPAASLDNPNVQNPIANPTETTTYTVTISDENGSQTLCAVTIEIHEPISVELIAITTSICPEYPVLLTLSEIQPQITYEIYDQEGNLIQSDNLTPVQVYPTETTTYSLIAMGESGCIATDEVTVEVLDLQLAIEERFAICEGELLSIDPITNFTALSYQWVPSTGISDPNILNPVFSPSETTTYTLITTPDIGCLWQNEVTIKVFNDCVYPADTDNNGIVNIFDLFPLGQHFGKQGPERNSISNDWQGFGVEDWSEAQSNGQNLKYADCNGNGTIGFEDIDAILQNFDATAKNGSFLKGKLGDPELQFIPNFETIGLDEWLELEVWIGSPENPITDLYAIAFETSVDVALIDMASVSIDFNSSQLGNYGEDLLAIDLVNSESGHIHVSLSQTNGSGISGQIHLLTIRMKSKTGLESPENLQFEITDFGATTSNEVPILVNLDELPNITIDPAVVHIETTTALSKPYQLYPTFTQSGFYLQYQSHQNQSVKVRLFDYSGRLVGALLEQASSNVGSFEQYIDLKTWNLATGVYIVELEVDGAIYREKIVWY